MGDLDRCGVTRRDLAVMLGARGKTIALASGLAAVVTFIAWPVIFFVLVLIGLLLNVLIGL